MYIICNIVANITALASDLVKKNKGLSIKAKC